VASAIRDSCDIGFSREIYRGIHSSGSEFFYIIENDNYALQKGKQTDKQKNQCLKNHAMINKTLSYIWLRLT